MEKEKSNENSISLNKYISSTGICSRREADKLITEGRVSINGEVAQLGNRVFDGDKVMVDGAYTKSKRRPVYIAYNKPIGIVCTTDPFEPKNIISQIKHKERLFPIGRLDKPSQGLIFLTNDGDIVNKILRAGNKHEKEYIVSVDKPITPQFIRKMGDGVHIMDTVTNSCKVDQINEFTFKIVLTQGMNRQIRRMCKALDYKVSKLIRIRIMNITLNDLKPGQWRELNDREISQILEMSAESTKTEEASKSAKKKMYYKKPFQAKKTEGSRRFKKK